LSLDPVTRAALAVPAERLGVGSRIVLERVATAAELAARFAADLLAEYRRAKDAGRAKVVLIVPVGPIGQFEALAERCNRERQSLADLVLVNMDEYLTPAGALLPLDDPLSFRRHMRDRLWSRLDPALAPPEAQRLFPDPADLAAVPRAIERCGGVDACFGGVGIAGHVAFNEPPEPGDPINEAAFAALPTRVVRLARETRTINAVTACRGNLDRIPETAVTVGMREILAARRVRLYLNRPWQCAIVRKLLHGPVTHRVPVTLLQRHADCRALITEEVAALPEPALR
jgi:glucosamine-6-phosphate deaminase